MRRSDRLFDIIQLLRTAKGPLTAVRLAEELEVAVRTIYRDIAALQARRVPIEGAPGIGYVLRRGFDLPPLMFTAEEIEAIAVGARLVRRTGDPGLAKAAEGVLSKLTVALPESLRCSLATPPFYVSAHGAPAADLSAIRVAIRDERKLTIAYADAQGNRTDRIVWPIAVAYYVESTLLGAWCELRGDFRHFRADRILSIDVREENFPRSGRSLAAEWFARFVPPREDAGERSQIASVVSGGSALQRAEGQRR